MMGCWLAMVGCLLAIITCFLAVVYKHFVVLLSTYESTDSRHRCCELKWLVSGWWAGGWCICCRDVGLNGWWWIQECMLVVANLPEVTENRSGKPDLDVQLLLSKCCRVDCLLHQIGSVEYFTKRVFIEHDVDSMAQREQRVTYNSRGFWFIKVSTWFSYS